ncbi:hypothetical protein LZ32DRAFT_648751 [Colletotrichum eremochloae]|nr:hypothetical protein LZ32DRAFT_648751 [Colletotrichum eremochloae]
MSNQTPSTPVKVDDPHPLSWSEPSELTSPSPPPSRIQEQLLHSLHANQANWPTLIQKHALNLLRTGEATTFPELLNRVLDDVRQDTLNPSASNTSPSTSKTNGTISADKDKDKKSNGTTTSSTPAADSNGQTSLAIPAAVIAEAIKVTQDSLEAVCEIDSTGN